MKKIEYIVKTARKLAFGSAVGLAALVGVSDSKADQVTLGNYSPGNTVTIGGGSADLQYVDLLGVSKGYDSGDQELLTYLQNPQAKNFVTYFPLDNGGRTFNAETNFIPSMRVGDSYTAYLAFSDDGSGIYGVPNKVSFVDFNLSGNSNGVTGLAYSLKVDPWGGQFFSFGKWCC